MSHFVRHDIDFARDLVWGGVVKRLGRFTTPPQTTQTTFPCHSESLDEESVLTDVAE